MSEGEMMDDEQMMQEMQDGEYGMEDPSK